MSFLAQLGVSIGLFFSSIFSLVIPQQAHLPQVQTSSSITQSSAATSSLQSGSPTQNSNSPTCTITATPSSAIIGQHVTLSWTSQNTKLASINLKSEPPQGDFDGLNYVPTSGSKDIVVNVIGAPGYFLNVSGPGGWSSCSTIITLSPSAASAEVSSSGSATVNQTSFALVSLSNGGPINTLTGTASNSKAIAAMFVESDYQDSTSYENVYDAVVNFMTGKSTLVAAFGYPSVANVVNGHWSVQLIGLDDDVSVKAYKVFVYDASSHALLTTATVNVVAQGQ